MIAGEGVTVGLITPSVLASLDPADLAGMEVIIAGGEAISADLMARWSTTPEGGAERRFHNAYGPTEATVATNISGVLRAGDRVTIGGPVRGMRALILDDRLNPVPEGVAGELYVGGIQLARGYHARSGLTAERFIADPYGEPGARLYRTGDVVRWRRDAAGDPAVEYVGRNDFQVKVRGFRIELGEIDAALTAHDSVDFAVTTGYKNTAGAVSLVSYVVAAAGTAVDITAVTAFAAERLPDYMVPASIMVIDEIPLTPAGKLDRKALPEPVFQARTAFRGPRNPVEQVIAEVFAEVLGVDRVGVDDSFFALGGDSIVSIQLVSRAKARGVVFTPRHVFEQRTVAGLAAIAESADADSVIDTLVELPGGGVGTMPPTPIVRFMAERPGSFGRFHQLITLDLPLGIDRETIAAVVGPVVDRHDMLRSRLHIADGDWVVETTAPGSVDVNALIDHTVFDGTVTGAELSELATAAVDSALDRLDPAAAMVVRFVWLEPDTADRHGRLVVVVHHLAIDGVSWRVLVPDFVLSAVARSAGQIPELPAPVTSMRTWAHSLERNAYSAERLAELEYWRTVAGTADPLLTERPLDPAVDTAGSVRVHAVRVSPEVTQALLTTVPALFHGGVNDGLLTALVLATAAWRAQRVPGVASDDPLLIRLEGHGREEGIVPGADLSRTIGWFTALFPVRFEPAGIDIEAAFTGGPELGAALKLVKEQLLAVPDKGVGYGLLRYMNRETAAEFPEQMPGQVNFNYLGRVGAGEIPEEMHGFGWLPAGDVTVDVGYDADMPAMALFDINAIVAGDTLTARIGFPSTLLSAEEAREFGDLWVQALEAVARHAESADAGGHTPSDFSLVALTQRDIETIEQRYPLPLADLWPLSALQAGMLFHAQLAATSVDVYTAQAVLTLTGRVDAERLRAAAQALVDRYENLRTVFVSDRAGNPVQVVLDEVPIDWTEHDRSATGSADDLVEADRLQRFDLTEPRLIRFTLIKTGPQTWQFVVSNHHILLDGWSMPLLMRDLLALYAVRADRSALPAARSYRHFLDWVGRQDHDASLAAWRAALAGVGEPTLLARPDSGGASAHEIEELSGEYTFELDSAATARIVALAAELGVTANTVLQVAWAVLLGRITSRDDVLFGATVSGRPPQLTGVETMVGLFINTIPVRVRFDQSETARELLARVQGEQADLLDHHYVGLADIHAAAGMATLFDTLLVFESYPVDADGLQAQATDIDGMAVTGLSSIDATHYPLSLIASLGTTLHIRAGYLRDTFDEPAVRRIADQLVRVLTALTVAPESPLGDIDLLDSAERDLVLRTWNDTAYPADRTATLVSMFDAQRTRTSDAPALTYADETLTYAEFATRVNLLARWLIDRGVGPESFVALGMRRSIDLVVGMYAVTVAGGAYVPLDPDHPAERTEYILATADPVCVLTSGDDLPIDTAQVRIDKLDLTGYADSPITDADRVAPLRAGNTAYVIFTSGSTGRPKGVAVSHAAIVNRLVWMQTEYGLTSSDAVLQKTPSTFDVSVWEFFWPLQIGARLVIAKPDGHRDPAYLAEIIEAERVTVTHFVPSMLTVFVAALPGEAGARPCASLRLVFASGEALPGRPAQRLRELTGTAVHNLYGPTEAAVDVTFHEVTDADTAVVPIGVPVHNTQVYVLDDRLRPVPVGVSGELYLAGNQLARGYVARPDLSADRFVANPFATGERMYRTGDVVRWNAAGELDYIGRSDFQVKLRGLRIELGEIETALTDIEEVGQAVVVLRGDARTGDQLVGYLVPAAGVPLDIEDVREDLSARLPSYMVPAAFVVLDELPLNASGKLDRRALPAPVFETREFRAPSTPIEEIVANTFAEVLGVERVGADDDFFALGGNSLSATRVAARLSTALDTDLAVRELFEAATVAALAARAESRTGARGRMPLVPQPRPVQTLPTGEVVERVPLSLAQQRMWFLNRFEPESAADNLPIAVRLSGLLDRQAMQIAIADVLARHESLRTYYPEVEGTPYQQVVPTAAVIPDLTPVDVSESDLLARVAEFVSAGFDLTAVVPFRVRLFEVDPTEHVLVVVVHHISSDGFSMGPLARDVITAYSARIEGGEPGWRPLEVQYADYALWQRQVLGSEDDPESVIASQIGYWSTELAGIPEQLDLPADRPRPAVASARGATFTFEIDEALHAELMELARTRGATFFMVVHAAFAVLLSRLSGETDIVVGTPVAGRGERALDDVIGMFVNTLALRTPIDSGAGFADLLAQVRGSDVAAFGNADLPFERLVEVLNPVRSQARHPLFQVMLSLQNNNPQVRGELPGLMIEGLESPIDTAKFDLQLELAERIGAAEEAGSNAARGVSAKFIYATDLFDEATVRGFADRFLRLLGEVLADPTAPVGDFELLAPAERTRVLAQWNATEHAVSDRLLLDGFERTAAAYPDRVAVSFEGTSLSYGEFSARVHRLARYLIAQGVGPESLVGLLASRSLDLVVGMYAVVAAGGAYVPLDPAHPAERIGYILDTAAPVCLLSTVADAEAVGVDPVDSALVGDGVDARAVGVTAVDADVTAADAGAGAALGTLAGVPVLALDGLDTSGFDAAPVTDADRIAPVRSSNTAYVIFTSGSTGRPKGVAVPHSAIANQVAWMLAQYPMDAGDVYLQKTATTFDVSLWGFFLPLAVGAHLVVATPDGHRDPAYLARVIAEQQVTVTDFVPSMLTVFAAHTEAGSLSSLEHVFVIGEALPPETVTATQAVTDAAIHNLYGPTEAAVSITYWQATGSESGSVPIGVPQWNSRVYVLDGRLNPVPEGVTGELYLAGDQLARGYVTRPDLSADRFVASPFDAGQRMYRTGDLVRWTQIDGQPVLEYLGRTDFQVKFRGQRIELGEIESAFLAQPQVSQAAVTISASQLGDQLVAYVVPAPGQPIEQTALLEAVRDLLPVYMVPAAVVVLDAFPLNTSGKLDRKALPEPTFEAREFRAPSTPIEEIVAGVFADVLGIERVGADDDFFALGGNSLIATQVAVRVGQALDTQVPVRVLFESPTVAALAAQVESQHGSGARTQLVPQPRPEQTLLSGETVAAAPLSLAQQRMWFLNRFDNRSAAYSVPMAVRLTGALDVAALGAAVGDLVGRHEVLRTVYPETASGPVQVVLPVSRAVPELQVRTVATAELQAAVAELVSTVFDVTTEVPLRVALFRVAETADEYVLAMVVHHISGDGSSVGPLTRDLMTAYAARTAGAAPAWAPLPVQYADYSMWQRELLGDEADPESLAHRQVEYWKETLAELPDQLDLPADRPRPAVQGYRGGRVEVRIDAETHRALAALGRDRNATLFMVVHSAFAVLLSRLGGVDDIAIGTPVAGRGEAALDDLIGMFVNTVVFRTRLDGDEPFTGLLARQREIDIAAFAHADVPFERLVEVLNPIRSTARHPLFQVGLSFQNLGQAALELPGLRVAGVDIDTEVSQFDLHLIVADTYDESGAPNGIGGYLTYAHDLFDHGTAQGFVDRFARLLTAIVADPETPVGDLELLTGAEHDALITGRNATARTVDTTATLASLLDATVAANSRATALVTDDGEQIGYDELDARVNRLARQLIALGVGPEDRVVLAFRRSVDLIVAMYAVAKSGGAYVPVDPDQPAERTGYILETAAPVCVLTNSEANFGTTVAPVVSLDELDLSGLDASPVTDADRRAPLLPAHTAYVIFTSGSTGRPKGVAVSHTAIANQLQYQRVEFGLDGADAVLLKTAATFDLSVWEFWSAAVCGGRLVIAAPDGHRDPAYLNELIRREWVTTLHVVPSMLDALLADDLPDSLWRVLAIGEALPAATAQRLLEEHPRVELYNLYGPTEAAVSVTTHRVTPADRVAVPIGVPQWNSRVYVLDSRLRPVPDGVAGELYLAGAQLARGYAGRADLTADRFVADPFVPGERMYRTGDLVLWHQGELVYRGRTDFQVKIRGFRIELGEIESALLALPEIAQTAVLAKSHPRTGDRLVGYLVPSGADVDIARVQTQLSAQLPSYMVPSAFVVLDALPLNINGKLDRKALPEPELEVSAFRAPSTPIEEIVAGVFAEVLGADRVGADDDFFAMGGNSLVATQVAARLGKALDTTVPVRMLFEAPTVAGLAVRVEQQAGAGGRAALVPQPRPERVLITGDTVPAAPLSLAQQRMWFLNRFDGESAAYNIPLAIRLSGALDVDALRAAVADVVARHEVLRTVYPETDSDPVQVVLPAGQATPELQLRTVPAGELTSVVAELASAGFDVTTEVPLRMALLRVADADAEFVLAMVVHHIAGDGSSLAPLTRDLMVAYAARTAGEAPGWAPLPVQYADYSIWQRELLGDETDPESLAAKQVEYWRSALAGVPDQLDLPADRPRPAVQSYAGGRVPVVIDAATHAGLQRVAQQQGATVFMAVHTALAVLLSRLSGTDDITIGTPMAGRGEQALDDLIGMFVNTLVFRTEVDLGESFADLLARQREVDIAAFAHADVPFERLVEVLNPVRSQARHPLFQVGFSFQNLAQSSLELPGLTVSGVAVDTEVSQFDLHLIVGDSYDDDGVPNGVSGELTYATDLFDRSTVQEFVDRFLRLLSEIVTDPSVPVGALDILAPAERAVLAERNSTVRELDSAQTLVSLLDASVVADPAAVALVAADGSQVTYAELGVRVNRLARLLIAEGVGPEVRVGLALRRSVDLVVAMYAVTVAGGVYVPLDPDQPAERSGYILGTAAPVCVLTNIETGFALSDTGAGAGAAAGIDAVAGSGVAVGAEAGVEVGADSEPRAEAGSGVNGVPVGGPPVLVLDELALESFDSVPVSDVERVSPLRASNTAYVIFTSGSTGRPKGVAVSHAAIVNQLRYVTSEFALDASDAVLLKTAATFDLSVWEFWTAAVSGGRMVIASPEGHRDPAYLNELMTREAVTTLTVVPSMLDALLTSGEGLSASLRRVLAIGEALPAATAQRMLADHPSIGLFNLYGPTEAAVSVTTHRVTGADRVSVPIGVPQWNSRVYVLDSRLRPVPDGVSGELYLAGAQLALGYFGRPDLSADRFVADPFAVGGRMYRTGDLVAWSRGGELEYRGRTDFQVKVRGFRIELGEIEAALLALPEVARAVVVAKSDPRTGDRLVAYVVPAVDATAGVSAAVGPVDESGAGAGHRTVVDIARIQAELGRRLPSYMVPAAFVELDALPLTVNGKLDRKALPEPVFETTEFRAASTPIEEIVANIFAEVLGADRVGADDDFFALGGNSLIATQVAARLGTALDTTVPVRAVFEASTVAGLAVRIEQHAGSGGRAPLVPQPRPERLPLSLAQQRMWLINQFDPSSAGYNIPLAIRLTGALDVAAMRAAVTDVLERHESLRTWYPADSAGLPYQEILPAAQVLPGGLAVESADDPVARIGALMSAGFDVTQEVPVRALLLDLGPDEHVLAFVAHHIAADGASLAPLARDLVTAYLARAAGEAPGWAPLPVQYADYALWQHTVIGDESDGDSVAAEQLAYWRKQLDGVTGDAELPLDRPRPQVPSMRGGVVDFGVDAEVHRLLDESARAQGVTLFMVMHAAVAVLLSRLTGTNDIVVGTPVAGRGERELDDLVGMFVNTLALRTQLDPAMTFAELLDNARETDLSAFASADIPFERVVEAVLPDRANAQNPLFDVLLLFQNTEQAVIDLPGLTVQPVDQDALAAKFDLMIGIDPRRDAAGGYGQLWSVFNYATDLFDESTVQAFGRRFERVLAAVAADPHIRIADIDILDAGERERMAAPVQQAAASATSGTTLPQLLRASVEDDPEGPAVVWGEEEITYQELDARSSRLARALIARGQGPGTGVVVRLDRGVEAAVATWAVLKAGAAVVSTAGTDAATAAGVTVGTGIVAGAVPDTAAVDWLVLDDPAVADEIAAQSPRPVTYADRVQPLRGADPAYVAAGGGLVSYDELAAVVARVHSDTELTYESRTFRYGPADSLAAVVEITAAGAAGASVVLIPEVSTEALADEWVTHLWAGPARLAELDPEALEDLLAIVLDQDGQLPAGWSQVEHVLDLSEPAE
ncbi:non-ribosomal peptide synthase/polyketide synthase [Nocardia flavorosea]|nr:non-ribosomal peptide synthase/polyketide synthase [Nocardia flavorosea]